MSQRKRYTKQFKEETLRLVSQEGVSLAQVAKDLSLDASMLRRWRKEVGIQGPAAFRGHGFAHDDEVAKLKRELGALGLEKAPGKTFIGRIAKDGLPWPAAVHHPIDRARIRNAERSGHPASLPRSS